MRPVGRPTKYTPELLAAAHAYAEGGWVEAGEAVPSIFSLALAIGIRRSTCYAWARDPDKAGFSDILERVAAKQEIELINRGLVGEFSASLAKMMLTKHGYSDKIEQAHSNPDGSLKPHHSGLDVSKLSTEALREIMEAAEAQPDG